MSRRSFACHVDKNQGAIVRDLRKAGVSIAITSRVGNDFPDLVWGFRQVTGLLEVKSEDGELEKGQREFIDAWRGDRIIVARTIDEAFGQIMRAVQQPRRG